jgi:hypothetical protein
VLVAPPQWLGARMRTMRNERARGERRSNGSISVGVSHTRGAHLRRGGLYASKIDVAFGRREDGNSSVALTTKPQSSLRLRHTAVTYPSYNGVSGGG